MGLSVEETARRVSHSCFEMLLHEVAALNKAQKRSFRGLIVAVGLIRRSPLASPVVSSL